MDSIQVVVIRPSHIRPHHLTEAAHNATAAEANQPLAVYADMPIDTIATTWIRLVGGHRVRREAPPGLRPNVNVRFVVSDGERREARRHARRRGKRDGN